jgi:spore coat protein CotH
MRMSGLGRVGSLLVLSAVLVAALLAGGCGSTTTGGSEQGSGGLAADYEAILADRYGGVFPDDRVQTVRIYLDDADWKAMQANMRVKDYYRADIWIDDEMVQDVAVRTKGSSSLMFAGWADGFRAGLKVDFNFFNAARSYHGLRKVVYNNGFSDPAFMREFLGYELMAMMGVPAPRTCFVDLWLNDEHLGVYTQVEAVDGQFVAEHFGDVNGNLYKPEVKAGGLGWTEADVQAEKALASASVGSGTTTTTTESFNIGGGDLMDIVEQLGDDAGWIPGLTDTTTVATTVAGQGAGPGGPGGPPFDGGGFMDSDADYLTSIGLRTNEDSQDYSRLYRLVELLDSDPAQVSKSDLEGVLQVDSILRFLAVSTALVHLDNYTGMAHNYYLYDDNGRFWIIPWDLNMSFGGFPAGLNQEEILGFYIDEPTAAAVAEYPLVEQLLDEPDYLAAYRGYLQQMIDGPFSVERMTARITEIADLIRPYLEKDEHMFFSMADFEQALVEDLPSDQAKMRSIGGDYIGLLHFVQARNTSIAAQLNGEQPASRGDGSGNGGVKGIGGAMGPQQGQGGPPGPPVQVDGIRGVTPAGPSAPSGSPPSPATTSPAGP